MNKTGYIFAIILATLFVVTPLTATPAPTQATSTTKKAECNNKLSDWQLAQNGIDAHQLKYDILGKKAKISLYELCACPDKTVVIRLKQCKGEEIYTGVTIK